MGDTHWKTVDFRPIAEPGWRIVCLDDGPQESPLAGWLVQEEIREGTHGVRRATGERRIVGAGAVEGEACPVTEYMGFWQVLGPGEPVPVSVGS